MNNGLTFNPDGDKLFVTNSKGVRFEYDLSGFNNQSDRVVISRECAEYAALCMTKEDRLALDFLSETFPQGRETWEKIGIVVKDNLTAELKAAIENSK